MEQENINELRMTTDYQQAVRETQKGNFSQSESIPVPADWADAWLEAIGFKNPAGSPIMALGTFQLGVLIFATIYDSGDTEVYGSLDDIGSKFSWNGTQLLYDSSNISADKRRRLAREIGRRLVFECITTATIPFNEIKFGQHNLVEIAPIFSKFFISDAGKMVWEVTPEFWFPRTLVGAGPWRVVTRPSIGRSIADSHQEFMLDSIEYPFGWVRNQIEAWVNRKWNLRDWVMEYRRTWGSLWRTRAVPEIEEAETLMKGWQPRIKQKTDFFFSDRSGQND